MKKINIENHFTVDRNSSEPVYQQLVEAVLIATKTGLIDRGDRLPSINELSRHYSVSRSTIEKSYNNLRDMGILSSQHGKSFYVSRLEPSPELKVMVLFNQLNDYYKEIYDGLAEGLGHRADIDFHLYYNSAVHLRHLLRKKQNASHIVVIPRFLDDAELGFQAMARIPDEKLIVLGRDFPGLPAGSGIVRQNLAPDICQALHELVPGFRKYQCVTLIFPEHSLFPAHFCDNFIQLCEENNIVGRVSDHLSGDMVRDGEAFVVLSDDHLMQLVREMNHSDLTPGKHVGIVSYRENDAKKAILNGITTVSPDFKAMGRSAADMVLTGHMQQIHNPCHVFIRGSL